MERTKEGAAAEMRSSLELLTVDTFDLYQLHFVCNMADLDQVTGKGGALDALIQARDEGLTRFIGITGHGVDTPSVFLEALERFDFDSVLFPINFVQYANPEFREKSEELLRVCRQRDVGTMIIKSICRGPWGEQEKNYDTWYQPFDDVENIQKSVHFALSQDITGICTAGDKHILPMVLDACENFSPMSEEDQEALVESASAYEPLFA